MLTPPGSWLAPKLMVALLLAWMLSSRVKQNSTHLGLATVMCTVRPNISRLAGTRVRSWLPSITRTPTSTVLGSVLATSRLKPPGLVLAM